MKFSRKEQFKNGKNLTGKDGLLAPLIKQLTEATLEAEFELHIANDVLNDKRDKLALIETIFESRD